MIYGVDFGLISDNQFFAESADLFLIKMKRNEVEIIQLPSMIIYIEQLRNELVNLCMKHCMLFNPFTKENLFQLQSCMQFDKILILKFSEASLAINIYFSDFLVILQKIDKLVSLKAFL